MAFILLISAYIWQAYQVNNNLRHKERQFALQSTYKKPGIGLDLTTVGALPRALKEEYPELVANYYRLDGLTCILSNGKEVFEENVSLGDSTLLQMYGFSLMEGDARTALSNPFSVVMGELAAMKYFGKKNVVGERLSIRNFAGETRDFEVTAVLSETGENSIMQLMPSMQTSIFLPLSSEKYFGRDVDNWENLWIAGFVELQEGITADQLHAPIQHLLQQHADEEVASNLQAKLKPLDTYYLDDNQGAIRQLILILTLTAAFLILMAMINFINLSISQSLTRLKEVGVRKIMGSSRKQLIAQLLIEYSFTVFVSGLLALAIYPALLPLFSSIMMKKLPALTELPNLFFYLFFIGTLCLGLLTGLYPAWKLSGNAVVSAVKSQLNESGGKHLIRRLLLFLQFSVAVVVLISSVVISRQVDTSINGKLGYNKDYLLTAQVPRDWSAQGLHKIELVQQELKQLAQVQEVSLSYGIPNSFGNGIQQISKVGANHSVDALIITSDQYFAAAYEIPVLAGKFFADKEDPSISSKIVINEKAAKALGYARAEDAIGQAISLLNGTFTGVITGVTADFYANSMHSASPAVVWFPVKASMQYRYLSIRLQAGSIGSALSSLEQRWKELLPEAPFHYKFMDETIQKMYSTEMQLKRASQTATVISVLIVVLGVVGLTSLSINLRLKEIGIRKVLGANLRNIVLLFSKEFFVLFAFALLVSIPIAYLLMHKWLNNFAVKMHLHPLFFAVPVLALLAILLFLIAGIVLRTNQTNPVKSLRDE
ncbi:ABC transporter permease [Sphingobacterium oryzagri]|uniref:ABC transporter permease n=1 Tax=Sphingobacterium oryzagri TaxID=3025669 RepID=A0ABY7WEH0_9SPHI|nr:ABC transporter permease [Sphingobacterium sp. KACC 22765]WDF68032.1 ABC transporter permease [Sphingobacterium sp. KACC 22765]